MKRPPSGGKIVRITVLYGHQKDDPLVGSAVQQSALPQRKHLHNRGWKPQPPIVFQLDKHTHTPFAKIQAKMPLAYPAVQTSLEHP